MATPTLNSPRTPTRRSRRAWAAPLAVLVACCSLAWSALPGRGATLDAARIKETVFPSGLRLLVKESRASDLASVQVWIRAGGFREDPSTSGTAHVIEHLIFKAEDAEGRPGSIDAEIENLGGLLAAATDRDWTQFNCTVAARFVGKVIPVVADALRKPQFRAEDLAAEKPVLQEEIDRVRMDPELAISAILHDMAYQEHPYRMDVRGTPQYLQRVNLKQVREYYDRYYVPSSMTVIVVGNVDTAGVERVVRAAFEADQRPAKQAEEKLPPEEEPCRKPERRVLNAPFANGYVGIAFPAPSVKDGAEVYAADLLLTILEHGGQGRLARVLKARGGVEASYETRRQNGVFTIIGATEGSFVEQAEGLLRNELDFIGTHAIPPAELEFAKRQLRGTYALDNESFSGQAANLGYYASIDRWQFASEYLANVQAVTPEQVQAVARKYMRPERSVSIVFKPRSAPAPSSPKSGT